MFSWTPTEAQGPGSYPFDVVVSDGTLTDTETITVTVGEVNQAPLLVDPGAQSDAEGVAVSLAIVAGDADLPSEALTFTASGLPLGLGIHPQTGLITGTVSYAASPGSPYTVTVTVGDSGTPPLSDAIEPSLTTRIEALLESARARREERDGGRQDEGGAKA